MTTIVIVVIGVTILTLGLRWIYNIFGGLEEQRTELIENTQEQIRKQFGDTDQPLNLLSSAVEVQQGRFKDVGVGIKNIYGQTHQFEYEIIPTDIPSATSPEEVLSWIRWDKSTIVLSSGQLYTDAVSLDPGKDVPLGVYKLKLQMSCIDCSPADIIQVPLTVRIIST